MEFKVYGGLIFIKGKHYRAVIATTSQKKAVEILQSKKIYISLYEFRNYWSETGNEKELEIALSKLNAIFYTLHDYKNDNYLEL